jgi:hypothetical protein
MAIQCPPNLDVEALQRAFDEVLRRHEAWRTVFREDGGRLLQVVLPPQIHRLRQVDLAGLPEDDRGVEARRLAEQDARRPFDLGAGPLWRGTLFDLGGLGHRLHLTLHHAIFDGVSVDQLLVAELTTLYGAFSQGRTSPLAELPIQYPDYAIWQRNWSEGPEAQAQLDSLREQLRGGARGTDQLASTAERELDVVDGRADRDAGQWDRIADANRGVLPALNRVADLEA